MPALAAKAPRVLIAMPGFAADCLETLEEIGIRARDQWQALGGEQLWLAPCPGADPQLATAIAGWLRRRAPEPHR